MRAGRNLAAGPARKSVASGLVVGVRSDNRQAPRNTNRIKVAGFVPAAEFACHTV